MPQAKASAVNAHEITPVVSTSYPKPFRDAVAGRSKRALGDVFGLSNFGVNLVELPPGCCSSQRHWHTHEDEFVYVLGGEPTLVTDDGEQVLAPGMVVGFPAAAANGHHLVNNSNAVATYLEVGDRIDEDEAYYPDIDLQLVSDGESGRVFTHRDGTVYDDEHS